jgi:hypothetical protein
VFPLRARDVFGRRGTSGVQDTHKTGFREVQYCWHPWCGQRVLVRCEARRGGNAVLRCVREDLNRSPGLEIPEWMFDSSRCRQMKQNSVAHVSSVALLALKDLLTTSPDPIESTVAEAQHLSSSSGDADAQTVTIPSPTGRAVCSTSEAAAVATGSAGENDPPVGPDAERVSVEAVFVQQRTTGGGR